VAEASEDRAGHGTRDRQGGSRAKEEVQCVACGRTAKTRCGRCRMEHYCGRDCQASHWKWHKATCRASPPASVPGSGGSSSSSRPRRSEAAVPL
ncbi:unnamed protein product, partial [Polarella glacialis]